MSTVYRAFDTTLERRVAVKLMHREIASDSDQLERFRREARSVAQLSHPHIVGVIDAGEEDGRPYIVFEYVEGETLKDRIRRMGRLPVDEAIASAIALARALGAAHARAIVHRDIKPQNVLVDEEGSAKVTDFGIARSLEEEGLTADGRVLGTTDYVSPEQALGHDVDGQSDIYSLGVVLYEMLTGDVPFQGENQVSVAMKHVREDLPDVQLMRPEVSARLAAVLDRMTDKDLAHRHPDAASVELDLEDALAAEASRTGTSPGEATAVLRTLPAAARRRLPLRLRLRVPMLLLALMIAVAGAVLYLLLDQAAERTRKGTGTGVTKALPGEEIISVKSTSANDYDPLGDDEEHDDQSRLAVDQDPGTAWTTETYANNILNKPTGETPGVGLYVDAEPSVNGRRLEIQTKEPGWKMELYATRSTPSESWPDDSWTRIGGGTVERRKQSFKLDTGDRRYRYYLVWITALPPDEDQVAITQLTLSAPKAQ
jgi:serine/threonine-protein kinase